MSSNKPRMTFRTEQEILDKLKYIADQEDRSDSKQLEHILKKYIATYEKKNGSIDTTNKPHINVGEINQNGNNNSINF